MATTSIRERHAPRDVGDARPEQYSLPLTVFLHLLPGAALTVFIVLAAPVARSMGLPTVFALFAGIGLVVVPIELGYLLFHAKRTTGSFSLEQTISYRERLRPRALVLWTAGLVGWFMAFLVLSTVFADRWLAETFFSWMPESVLQFSMVGDAGTEPVSGAAFAALIAVALLFNGVLGPVVEELYFRGHLLPRIERLGRGAPVLNTVLFSLYHFWTPWQNPARIIGFLPLAWAAWRKRSVQVSMTAHVTINLLFLLLLMGAFATGAA